MQQNNSKWYMVVIAALVIIVIVAAIVTLIASLDGDEEETGIENRAPVAIAPSDISALSGETIILDASNSSDPDGDELSFNWDLRESVDSNGDGNTKNDRDLTGIKVEYVVPEVAEDTIFEITLMVSDENHTTTDLLYLNIMEPREVPEVVFSTNYGDPPGLIADEHYILTVESVSRLEDLDRYTYSIESPDGVEYLSGDIEELVMSGLNETVRYTDLATSPEGVDKVSEGDNVLVRDTDEVIENSVFLLYYMDDPDEAGRAVLTRDIVP